MTVAAEKDPHNIESDPSTGMGIPLPNGKLAMWFFLITEIMFFTALIGTYLILRGTEWAATGKVTLPVLEDAKDYPTK